jgi:hypothetical protein
LCSGSVGGVFLAVRTMVLFLVFNFKSGEN